MKEFQFFLCFVISLSRFFDCERNHYLDLLHYYQFNDVSFILFRCLSVDDENIV